MCVPVILVHVYVCLCMYLHICVRVRVCLCVCVYISQAIRCYALLYEKRSENKADDSFAI